MRHRLLQLLLAGSAGLACSSGSYILAGVVPAHEARTVEVTVFRDRAEIVRLARVQLPAGASTVEFGEIPFGVDADSVRVSAEGVPSTLGAVEVRERAEEPQDGPEMLEARERVRGLEREVATLDAARRVDGDLRGFLDSIRASVAKNEAERLGQGQADPQAIGELYGLVREKYRSLAEDEIERNDEQRKVQEQLAVARAKLQTLRPGATIRSRVASVEVETRSAGMLELRLAFVTPGATWHPSYRASLDAESGRVDLVAEGVVRQNTGEDWTSVDLRLSTASPLQGVEPPLLTSWYLRPVVPMPVPAAKEGFAEESRSGAYQNVLAMAPGVASDAAVVPSGVIETTLTSSAYSVTFNVPGHSDIPADSRDHRVVLRSESLAGRVVHRSVPALAARAYLTSVTTSPKEYPLLAGPVRVSAGGGYLGSFPLEEKGPGVEVTIPFGIDNRIEIVRVPQPRNAGRTAGGKNEVEYAFKTEIHNLQDRAVTLVLEDRVPVGEDERIDVEIDKATTTGWKPSERRPGVMLWTLDLKPHAKQEIVLAYTVRYPKELFLSGLP